MQWQINTVILLLFDKSSPGNLGGSLSGFTAGTWMRERLMMTSADAETSKQWLSANITFASFTFS